MKIEILMSKLFGFSPQTYFNWKKDQDKRPIIKLLSQYFSKEDLEEFLKTSKVMKLEWQKLGYQTFYMLQKSFFDKIAYLYENELDLEYSDNLKYFYNFIIYYISYDYCYYSEEEDIVIWEGLNNIEEFRELYYSYLLQNNIKSKALKEISPFINMFDENNLAYLNISIADGFLQLLKSDEDYYSANGRTNIKKEFIYGLEETLKKSINNNTPIDEIKSPIQINEIISKLIELKIKDILKM